MKKLSALRGWLPIFALFTAFGLSACSRAVSPTSSVPTPLLPTLTEPAKVVRIITPTPIPTAIQRSEASPMPTPNPWKTSTEQTPAWLAAPGGDDVALINLCGQPEQCDLVFVNSTTTETYTLTIPEGADYYFWLPDTPSGPSGMKLGLVYLPDDLVIYRLANGEIEEKQFDPSVLRYLGEVSSANTPLPVFSYRYPSEKNWFLFVDDKAVSFDYRYIARKNWNELETPILIDDLNTGDSVQLTNATDGRYDVAFAWSPIESFLAILQSSEPPMPSAPDQVAFHDTHLLVDDVAGGSIEAGDGIRMASIRWSPDGKKILYLSGTTSEINNLPCWLDLSTGLTQCADAIPRENPVDYLTDLDWIPGQDSIIFLRHSSSALTDELCIYNLNSEAISCKIHAVEGRKITSYHLAPGAKAVFFIHDTIDSSVDDPEAPYAALASLDGSWSIDLAGKEVYDQYGWNPALLGVLWRTK